MVWNKKRFLISFVAETINAQHDAVSRVGATHLFIHGTRQNQGPSSSRHAGNQSSSNPHWWAQEFLKGGLHPPYETAFGTQVDSSICGSRPARVANYPWHEWHPSHPVKIRPRVAQTHLRLGAEGTRGLEMVST